MNNLKVFVKDKSWEDVVSILSKPPYNINVSEDDKYYLLKYNQIESDFTFDIVKECRGVILRKKDNKIVCAPFTKFFNYGEAEADSIDWETASTRTKIDGSITKVWADEGEWHLSTNGTIDAFKTTLPIGKSFGDLFLEALKNIGYDWKSFMQNRNPDHTYIYELTSPYNRVVVPYDTTKIWYLGTRSSVTFNEMFVPDVPDFPKEYKFNSIDDVIAMAKDLPFSDEGYVVCDGDFNRVKIKSPAYLAVHRLVNNHVVSKERILELVKTNEHHEFLTVFPEYKKDFDEVEYNYKTLIGCLITEFVGVARMFGIPKKDFAMYVKNLRIPDVFFRMYDSKVERSIDGIKKYVLEMDVKKLVILIESVRS